jgi:hypothetical protein
MFNENFNSEITLEDVEDFHETKQTDTILTLSTIEVAGDFTSSLFASIILD